MRNATSRATSPFKKAALRLSPANISGALAPASGITNAVAFRRSGLILTSVTVMLAVVERRVAAFAFAKDLRQRVPQLFPDAQLALAGARARSGSTC